MNPACCPGCNCPCCSCGCPYCTLLCLLDQLVAHKVHPDQAAKVAAEFVIAQYCPRPSGMDMILNPKGNAMNTSKFLKVKSKSVAKGASGFRAAPTQVNLTDLIAAGGVIEQVLDQNGNPLSPQPDASTVTPTMTVDSVAAGTGVTVSPVTGTLGFTLSGISSVEASSGAVITLTGVLTYNDGSVGPFSAPLGVLCNVPPNTPIPSSIAIILA